MSQGPVESQDIEVHTGIDAVVVGTGSAPLQDPGKKTSEPNVATAAVALPPEIGGRGGLEPTRYGDWEKAGRCIDF